MHEKIIRNIFYAQSFAHWSFPSEIPNTQDDCVRRSLPSQKARINVDGTEEGILLIYDEIIIPIQAA